jgi:Family of unknown function (DUF6092)
MTEDHDQELFNIITYLVCSAPVSLDETRVLGAYRFMDAANRLMLLAAGSTVFAADPFLDDVRADYDAHVNLGMTDQTAFTAWLGRFAERFTVEQLARTQADHTAPEEDAEVVQRP